MADGTLSVLLPPHKRFAYNALMKVRPAPLASLLKRLLRVRRVPLATPHGVFSIDPVSNFGRALGSELVFEPGMIAHMQQHLRPGGSFIDIGANEGYFTVIGAGMVGPNGRVVAIEPQRRLIPVIEQNLQANGVTFARVLNEAISDAAGVGQIHLTADTNSGSSGLHATTKYRLPQQAVTVRKLVDVLDAEALGRIDFMKMDIEGGEYEAVLGSSEIFRQHRVRVLAMELHPRQLAARGKSEHELIEMLASAGYRMDVIAGQTIWFAPQ